MRPTPTKANDFPRDPQGHFITRKCPECRNGTLQFEGDGEWRCDGLADPNDSNKELVACEFAHIDGPVIYQPCGAGCWNNKIDDCEHDVLERHEVLDAKR